MYYYVFIIISAYAKQNCNSGTIKSPANENKIFVDICAIAQIARAAWAAHASINQWVDWIFQLVNLRIQSNESGFASKWRVTETKKKRSLHARTTINCACRCVTVLRRPVIHRNRNNNNATSTSGTNEKRSIHD